MVKKTINLQNVTKKHCIILLILHQVLNVTKSDALYQVPDMTNNKILHQVLNVTKNDTLYQKMDVTKRDILHQVCLLD